MTTTTSMTASVSTISADPILAEATPRNNPSNPSNLMSAGHTLAAPSSVHRHRSRNGGNRQMLLYPSQAQLPHPVQHPSTMSLRPLNLLGQSSKSARLEPHRLNRRLHRPHTSITTHPPLQGSAGCGDRHTNILVQQGLLWRPQHQSPFTRVVPPAKSREGDHHLANGARPNMTDPRPEALRADPVPPIAPPHLALPSNLLLAGRSQARHSSISSRKVYHGNLSRWMWITSPREAPPKLPTRPPKYVLPQRYADDSD